MQNEFWILRNTKKIHSLWYMEYTGTSRNHFREFLDEIAGTILHRSRSFIACEPSGALAANRAYFPSRNNKSFDKKHLGHREYLLEQ